MRPLIRKSLTAKAISRYSAERADLYTLGELTDDLDYQEMSIKHRDHVAGLIDIVTDEALVELPAEEPAAWAQIHALRVLRELKPAEAQGNRI